MAAQARPIRRRWAPMFLCPGRRLRRPAPSPFALAHKHAGLALAATPDSVGLACRRGGAACESASTVAIPP